ncbi:unnamed protein product [Auanema sp. JU1783]|nr:unnamed protein product [Auanema sp. JU1783]
MTNVDSVLIRFHVGMIGYSGPGRTHVLFDLDKHSNKDDLIEEMFKMVATGGTTRTGEAITFATKELLKNKSNGTRSNAKKVLVVFTDGYSQDDPMAAASNARHQGIRTIVVAMEDHIAPNHSELLHIAGQKEYILLSPKGSQLRERILGNSCTLTAI